MERLGGGARKTSEPSSSALYHRDERIAPNRNSKADPITDYKATFEEIPLSLVAAGKLYKDAHYTRESSPNRLARLRSTWNPAFVGTIYVSKRKDGSYAVVDGWHRVTVGIEKEEKSLPALVYHDLSIEQEAELYHRFGNVFAQSALVRFKARVQAGDPSVQRVVRAVEDAGLRIDYTLSLKNRAVRAVSAMEYVAEQWGQSFLWQVLSILRDTLGTDVLVFRDDQITGLAHFLSRYNRHDGMQITRLMKRMKEDGQDELRHSAGAIKAHLKVGGFSTAFGMAIRESYNHYLRMDANRLPEWTERVPTPKVIEAQKAQTARLQEFAKAATPEERSALSKKGWESRRSLVEARAREQGILCSVEGCSNAVWARDMCKNHYNQDAYRRKVTKAKEAVAKVAAEVTAEVAAR